MSGIVTFVGKEVGSVVGSDVGKVVGSEVGKVVGNLESMKTQIQKRREGQNYCTIAINEVSQYDMGSKY